MAIERTDVSIIILLDPSNRVLLQRKDLGYVWSPGSWCFFGGKVESGEKKIDAISREVTEELGITVQNLKFFKKYSYEDTALGSGRIKRGYSWVYSGRFDGDLTKIRLGEGAGFSLYEESEIPGLNLISHNKNILLEFYASIKK